MVNIFHYCGHIISRDESGRFPRSNEDIVKNVIDTYFKPMEVSSCYGSLASGADILFAETLINKGASLHLILPFEKEHFINLSVRWSGSQWVKRFDRLINRAESVTQVYCDKPKDENLSFALCTEIALGLGLKEVYIKQEEQGSQLQQLTLWDQQLTEGIAGTYPDMNRAQAIGLSTTYISCKQPIEIHIFKKTGNVQLQILELVVYDKQHSTKEINITGIEALISHLQQHSLSKNQCLDFNRNKFGHEINRIQNRITDRALAHIFFHCYAKKNFNNREQFFSSLFKLQNSTATSGNSQ